MSYYLLRNKVALVTGASRRIGLGAAIARGLAEAGANIFLTFFRPYDASMPWGSNPGEVEELLNELKAIGGGADGYELDLANSEAPAKLFDRIEKSFGPVDIVVNNAAHSEHDGIDALSAEVLDRHYSVNVRAMALICTEFARRFRNTPLLTILNSIHALGQRKFRQEV